MTKLHSTEDMTLFTSALNCLPTHFILNQNHCLKYEGLDNMWDHSTIRIFSLEFRLGNFKHQKGIYNNKVHNFTFTF